MCIHSTLRLHITHLLQRRIFSTTVHDRLSIRGVYVIKPPRSKKHNFFSSEYPSFPEGGSSTKKMTDSWFVERHSCYIQVESYVFSNVMGLRR